MPRAAGMDWGADVGKIRTGVARPGGVDGQADEEEAWRRGHVGTTVLAMDT